MSLRDQPAGRDRVVGTQGDADRRMRIAEFVVGADADLDAVPIRLLLTGATIVTMDPQGALAAITIASWPT